MFYFCTFFVFFCLDFYNFVCIFMIVEAHIESLPLIQVLTVLHPVEQAVYKNLCEQLYDVSVYTGADSECRGCWGH